MLLAANAANYSYDSLQRLTSADFGDGTIATYEYDANGNRLSRTVQSNFRLITVNVPNGGGTVSGGGITTVGTVVTLQATPDSGNDLNSFTESGTVAGVSFTASTSALLHKTEILFPNPAFIGINPPPSATYYFLNGAWHKVGEPVAVSFSDTVILPDSYIIQRNKSSSTQLTNVGSVITGPLATLVLAQAGTTKQDNAVALRFAGTVTLSQSNLVQSGAFQPSTSALIHKDELLVFDNTATGINKAAVATYFYLNNAWRKVGSAVTLDFGGDTVFKPGAGVAIRKAGGGATAQELFWVYNVTGL